MKAVNIQWDVDDPRDLENLPTEIELPEGMNDEDEISDYISDVTGFCHYGFELEECRMKLGELINILSDAIKQHGDNVPFYL